MADWISEFVSYDPALGTITGPEDKSRTTENEWFISVYDRFVSYIYIILISSKLRFIQKDNKHWKKVDRSHFLWSDYMKQSFSTHVSPAIYWISGKSDRKFTSINLNVKLAPNGHSWLRQEVG